MPFPTPSKGQSEDDFIESCMGNPTMKKEFSDHKQRLAVCHSQFRKSRSEHIADYTAERVDLFIPIVRAFEVGEGKSRRWLIYGYSALFESPDAYGTVIDRSVVEKSFSRLRKYPAFRYMHRSPLGQILFDEQIKTPDGKLVSTFVDSHGFHILAEVNRSCEKEWSFINKGGWGLSYGLLPHKIERRRFNGKLFDVFVDGELYEISAVDTPAHEDAAIHIVNRRLVADYGEGEVATTINYGDTGGVTVTNDGDVTFGIARATTKKGGFQYKGEKKEMEKEEVEQMLKDSKAEILDEIHKAIDGKQKQDDFKTELETFKEEMKTMVQTALAEVPKKDDTITKDVEAYKTRVESFDTEITKIDSLKRQLAAIGEDTSSLDRRMAELEKLKNEFTGSFKRSIESLDKRLQAVENAPDYHSPATTGGKAIQRGMPPIGFRAYLDTVGE